MLPAAARLRRRTDFQTTVRRGRRAGSVALVVHLLPTREPEGGSVSCGKSREKNLLARVGFVVSRAVGGAVIRNRVRRRLRHLVRARLAGLAPGAQIVVRALPAAANRSYRGLEADFDAAYQAAHRTASRRRSPTGRR